ncbi:pentatricopeptide repeat-containing mitochondrial-like [Brachionus plicatilis]|uniref:Pentatricopeptide repeat-containing mitochondrial-like n=1 Tax=Brachionus plicatilis TaxID=10195 RepID=A0A3M7RNJ2_BRAPC|nr:pentatricopeptide repeat-containing mitochondrial-like [Brachionus plicatilis]
MSFVLKSVSRVFQRNFLYLSGQTFKINTRLIYDASVFGIKEYENARFNAKIKASPGLFNSIKNRLQESISNNSNEIEQQDLNMFLLLSKTDDDLELILQAFKKIKNLLLIDRDEKFGERFTKLCYLLDNSDKIIEALNDDEVRPSLMGQLTSFLLMNRFIMDKKNDMALKVFDQYLENIINRKKFNERPDAKTYLKKQNQLIPFGHLRLAFEALLNINTKESFKKMQEVLKQVETFKSKPNNTALACCFLLALRQNEPNFAYQIALSVEKFNLTLTNNLKAIALLKQGRIDEAFYFLDSILNIKPVRVKNDFEGKFFPDALQAFSEEIEKLDEKNTFKREKFELLLKEANMKLFYQDLYGYCTNVNIKSNALKNK